MNIHEIFVAIDENNCRYIEKIIGKDPEVIDINQIIESHSGVSPLTYAVYRNNPKIVDLLISHCANVNYKDFQGWTPLCYACKYASVKVVDLLLKNGASLNIGLLNYTPMRIAIESGSIEIVKYLSKLGVKFDQESDGYNCLMYALFKKQYEMMRYLIDIDIDLNEIINESTVLDHAQRLEDIKAINLLILRGGKTKVEIKTNILDIDDIIVEHLYSYE
jgi:ankyrin repeat protein